ncbi:NUDIX domain-containing protein [uncultured Psychrobacillus sp.]|uniref:NUDIX hydrolase n=1 Tax=uncultured Psychrobacillus sp. TaxID=1551585 RepID=UPI0026035D4C|nr:NUDIX domain-containing protein [uncultured Psychrobacillus sp.]
MLNYRDSLPKDRRIADVHCIPITEQGMIMLSWDKAEQQITTIGGRLENGESLEEALEREVMEEVGITLTDERVPFASWYWSTTDTYTVWYLSKIKILGNYDFNNEKTGYIISNFSTFEMMIKQLESKQAFRLQILQLAKKKALEIKWLTK